MSIIGWYYLHVNGDLIYKPEIDGSTIADIRESDMCKSVWPFDPQNREGAWRVVVEALALGAKKERVLELADKWQCNDEDAAKYAEYMDIGLSLDGNQWCATPSWFENLQESPAGFGDTCLEAFAELAKELGLKTTKMWGATFHDLLHIKENGQFGVGA